MTNCEGCALVESPYINGSCFFVLCNYINECPCVECLVKAMCCRVCDKRIVARSDAAYRARRDPKLNVIDHWLIR